MEIPAETYKSRRGWLIAFGVVEILIACFSLLFALLVLLLPHLGTRNAPEQASMSPGMIVYMVVLYGAMAALFLAIGVGSIRCRNWARIAMLVASGLWLGVGVLSTLFILLLFPTIIQQRGGIPSEARHLVLVAMIAMMGFFMVVMPTAFLVFYSRKTVKATCLSHGTDQVGAPMTGELPVSKVPVPVIVLAIWQSLGVFGVLAFLWVRATVVFGAVLHGPPAFLVLLAHSALNGYAAWSIYRRKLVGWAIAMFNAVFWTASTVTTFAKYDAVQLSREIGLSEQQLQAVRQFPQVQSMIWLSTLPMMIGLLVLLLYTKKFFPRAGSEATFGSSSS